MITQSLPSIANRFIEIEGVKIAYNDTGTGKVLLCLHAIGHSSSDFISLHQLPLDRYQVIAIDFPGHGKSAQPVQPVSATYFAEVVKEFIKQLKLNDVVIIGNSIGGATAIRIAALDNSIKALALADPGGLDKGGITAKLFTKMMAGFFKMGADKKPSFAKWFARYYRLVLPTLKAKERRDEIIASGYTVAPLLMQAWQSFGTDQEDLRPLTDNVQCPVLFTWGTKDKVVQLGRSIAAIKRFKHYRLIKYPIGHTPYIECPDEFLRDIQEFV